MRRCNSISAALCALFALFALATASISWADGGPQTFGSPEAAAKAFVEALRDGSQAKLADIFGGSGELLASGDDVADRSAAERFLNAYETKHAWVPVGDNERVLEVGKKEWPFPIPLVREGSQWYFDSERGADEMLNRRIGRNELGAIQACLAFVEAQREYRDMRPQGKAEYARSILSGEGKKDGLHWVPGQGEEESPLGAAFARARAEGYDFTQGEAEPFHGYYYRILAAQGTRAPGGAYDYREDGSMTRGFALVAWPSRWDVSGVMTFVVSHSGAVYEKNLGPDTDKIASTMVLFNPDESWNVVTADAEKLPHSE